MKPWEASTATQFQPLPIQGWPFDSIAGARPSPGAASPAGVSEPKCFGSCPLSDVAAPEDGRAPTPQFIAVDWSRCAPMRVGRIVMAAGALLCLIGCKDKPPVTLPPPMVEVAAV